MNEQQEELTDAIIDFQVKHHVNDTDLAFASHLSVEKVHAMKTGFSNQKNRGTPSKRTCQESL